ncbi:MAG: iron-sulfur cluster assembly scaffold protein [Hyphomicrobiales bacterium]|nr:iron-sulfur cluster assembly scaffold protein [Hyphomicrobiales bacterium]
MTMAVDLGDLYSGRILELAANMPRARRLEAPGGTATAQSKLCGSVVTVDVIVKDGVIADYGQDVRACLLGQTSAAVMGANAIGVTATEVRDVGAQMRRMLKQNGEPPTGKWADLSVLQMVRDYKARHASVLLVFDALEAAIADIEQQKPERALSE